MPKFKPLKMRKFIDYLYITIGLLLYALGWALFLLPYKMVTGGTTGIAALVYYSSGIPVSYTYFAINVVLLVVALKILGFKFLAKTTYAIIMLTVFLDVFQNMVTMEDGTLYQLLGPGEQFMSVIIGGVLTGTAIAIVLLRNGSTGGTDIIAAVV
ncbi:MAG: YitT family protein, partial [Bacteroidales bacterium]|nr:YitT family protein [Bacteroidales bacterium]